MHRGPLSSLLLTIAVRLDVLGDLPVPATLGQ